MQDKRTKKETRNLASWKVRDRTNRRQVAVVNGKESQTDLEGNEVWLDCFGEGIIALCEVLQDVEPVVVTSFV